MKLLRPLGSSAGRLGRGYDCMARTDTGSRRWLGITEVANVSRTKPDPAGLARVVPGSYNRSGTNVPLDVRMNVSLKSPRRSISVGTRDYVVTALSWRIPS